MIARLALVALLALILFGAGFALAKPEKAPRVSAGATDAAPQALAIERIAVKARLAAGAPAPLHAPPVRRKPARPRRTPVAPVPRPVVPVSTPTAVATPAPQPVSTPAPTPRPVFTPAPRAPAPAPPRPAPTPRPPSYVGSGFDDSG